MQSTNLPSKYLVPFAKNDGAKVEIPVTTATAGRASQSLGFPPITGQPPEAGGLPPQLEDFNGAINQIARVTWWSQLGGKFPFDNTFATDSNINGYPIGAELVASDNAGTWLSLADNNVANPDTTGTGWAPARAYGAFALTGQTGGTVTPTPVQAMKRRITIAGALTSNLTVILPNWLYSWDITNNTSGAFTVTVKTAAGAGVVIPQNGAPTPVSGDGTNIVQPANNIPAATTPTQAAQFSQTIGRLLNVQTFTNSGTYTPTAGTTRIKVTACGGGGGGGGSAAVVAGQGAAGVSGGGGGWAMGFFTSGFSGATVTVGVGGGGGGAGNNAGAGGGASSFLTLVALGGSGGAGGASVTVPTVTGSASGGGGSGGNIANGSGSASTPGVLAGPQAIAAGASGGSLYGGTRANATVTTQLNGPNGTSPGAGGAGGVGGGPAGGSAAASGGNGFGGVVIIEEYS